MYRRGFTLLELLVVIALIGIMASLAIVSLDGARMKSRDTGRLAAVKQIQNALELYYGEHNGYPTVSTPTDLSTALTPYLVPKYAAAVKYDMANISGPVYYSPANNPASYLLYVSTEMQWGSAYGCRTGVGPDITNTGLYSTAPVCH